MSSLSNRNNLRQGKCSKSARMSLVNNHSCKRNGFTAIGLFFPCSFKLSALRCPQMSTRKAISAMCSAHFSMFQETQASLLVTAIFWWEHFLNWTNAQCCGCEAHHTGRQYILKTVVLFCDKVPICSWDSWSSSLHLPSTWKNLHWVWQTALFDELCNRGPAVLADSFSIGLTILAPCQSMLVPHQW